MKRVRAALVLVPLGWLASATSARAAWETFETQQVKTSGTYQLFAEDGHDWLFSIACSDSFSADPLVTIAPSSGDPGSVTANPVSMAACPWVFSGAQAGAEMTFTFNSLRDLGNWDITCNGYFFDPDLCWSSSEGTCGFTCPPEAVAPWANPFTFHVEVWNEAPAASISASPAPAWNATVTFDANSSDPDGGAVAHAWSIVTHPSGSSAGFSATNIEAPTMTFSNDDNIGDWAVRVTVDDDEGERKTFDKSFTIPNVETPVSISGALDIDATEDIELVVAPTDDIDGGALTLEWTIVSSPPGASVSPQSNFADGFGGDELLNIPTTDADIGTWVIEVQGTDNEGHSETDQVTVTVKNIPPEIELEGDSEVDVGDMIDVWTNIVDDEDGGSLTFEWWVVQAPTAAGQAGLMLGTDSYVPTQFTADSDAGSWIFELIATDDEGESVDEQWDVLVDAEPTATIAGPAVIDPVDFPLYLDGTGSTDPDSDAPHTNVDGAVMGLSDGIVEYTWYLIEAPPDHWLTIPPGPVDSAFGIDAHTSTLTLDFLDVGEGDWIFQLEVVDGEGNTVWSDNHTVTVLPVNVPPTAYPTHASRFEVVGGFAVTDIVVDGSQSFDWDNITDGFSIAPGEGIDEYLWVAVPPPGCAAPAMTGSTPTLYPAGSLVPPECHGVWTITLTVRDDDTPQLEDSYTSTFVIGNCATFICIDSPTTFMPAVVEFTSDTDVWIYYHLDSALYDDPLFGLGMYVEMYIYHESDPVTPAYSDVDANVLASDKGGFLVFNWNGWTDGGERPLPGKYSIQLVPVDYTFASSSFFAIELDSILMQVAELTLLPGSDRYVDYRELGDGSDTADIQYTVTGASFDQLEWRVRDSGNAIVAQGITPAVSPGTFSWDGTVTAGGAADPGDYTVELEAFKSGASLGVSDPWALTVYRLTLEPSAGPVPAGPPGLHVFVNDDDDNQNAVADLTETAAGEDDLVELKLEIEPATLSGEVTLSTPSAGPAFNLWETAAKATAVALPTSWDMSVTALPATLVIEANAAEATNLRLDMTVDLEVLTARVLDLSLVGVAIMEDTNNDHAIGAGDVARTDLRVALWDNAYDAAFVVANAADPANYIEQDTRRFYLRVQDPRANADPAVAETLVVPLETLRSAGAAMDDATAQTLTETGVNTGVFVSRSQVLMTEDFPAANDANADDEHAAHAGPGAGAAIADDVAGDRNHQVEIDGRVRVSYQPAGLAAAHPWALPVCARTPEERRVGDLRVRVFNEPFQDQPVGMGNGVYDVGEPFLDLSTGAVAFGLAGARGGVVDAAHVASQIERANRSWAQACVRFASVAVTFVDAPLDALGQDMLADGAFTLGAGPATDETLFLAAFAAAAGVAVVEVFFVGPIAGANAVTRGPVDGIAAVGENTFVYMAPNLGIDLRTLAHELGHCMDNGPDGPNTQLIFYPADNTFQDNAVNSYRRVTLATITNCRTVRGAGAMGATGNRFLHNP